MCQTHIVLFDCGKCRVVEGMTVEQIEGYFKGISCSGKGTSCSDQLATAVRAAYEKNSN